MKQRILMWLFTWAGGKLFPLISIYAPDDIVKGVIFTTSEEELYNCCEDLIENKGNIPVINGNNDETI